MAQRSAGLLLYRFGNAGVEVLLVRPGGPYWRGKDTGAWQIPKGLIESEEDSCAAACRETEEELGVALRGTPVTLDTIKQAGGKIVEAFALEQDVDPSSIKSSTFELEWPPKSGRRATFPEIETARWLSLPEAEGAMLKSQKPLLEALKRQLASLSR